MPTAACSPQRDPVSKATSERAKLKRALKARIAMRALPLGSDEWKAAVNQWTMTYKQLLTPREQKARHKRWLEMGSPELDSSKWKAELQRLRKPKTGRQSMPPANAADLERQLRTIAVRQLLEQNPTQLEMANESRQAKGLPPLEPVELFKVPGQSNYRQTKEEQAEARRLYRWLWRHFPGQLEACDDELRELIRKAGGIA